MGACRPPTSLDVCGLEGNACQVCSDNQRCNTAGTCIDRGSSDGGMKRIFVTATAYDGNLGGLTGADQKCNLAAQSALLGGVWKAWLSDSTTNAIDRIEDVGPWKLVFYGVAFNNKANMATIPHIGIDTTEEYYTLHYSEQIWTGTKTGGHSSGSNCGDWLMNSSSVFGSCGSASASSWTEQANSVCVIPKRFYCIEQ